MESRAIYSIIFVVFVQVASHAASSQSLEVDAPIPCQNITDCEHPRLPAGATCVSGACMCTDETGVPHNCRMTHSQAKAAVPFNPKTRICKSDRDCDKLQNGFCNTTVNQCACNRAYVMSTTSYFCLPISRSMGSNCDQNDQCSMTNSTCRNNQCVCNAGFHYTENACWRSVEIGKSCNSSEECSHVTDAVCNEQGTCMCSNNTVLNSDGRRCLPILTRILEECAESGQCSEGMPGAECIDKRCNCRDNSHFVSSKSRCVATKHLGDACADSSECFQDREGEAQGEPQSCLANVCKCNENFKEDGDKCVGSGAGSREIALLYLGALISLLLFSRS